MAKIKDKVDNALNEARMLVLGAQVLVGFQFRSVFEPGYEKLPRHSQYLKLVGLEVMIIAMLLLILPAAYHRIVEDGEDTQAMHRFTGRVMDLALLPFALGLGLDLFVATEKVGGLGAGVVGGICAAVVALFFWYGLEFIRRPARRPEIKEKKEKEMEQDKGEDSESTKITDKIKHLLTEARVVLPGVQALLGFQLATMFMESFDKLPESSKYIHLASLSLISLTVVLLITPAAYHRIVEEGEETRHFHRFGSRMLLASMVPLALAVSGDLFVVARRVTGDDSFAVILAATTLVLFYGMWFGLTTYLRARNPGRTR
ncbi:MAG TPA: DUF6328 family protein [Blastocatellia bacterium]|nr:DUF6328 family protein [Blastocatellia bacterium]